MPRDRRCACRSTALGSSIPMSTFTVKAACPHDCPDTCAMKVTVEKRDGKRIAIKVVGAADHPPRRRAVHQGQPLSGAHLSRRPAVAPDEAHRSQGRGQVRARELGRGVVGNRRALRRYTGPLLVAVGADDRATPPALSKRLYEAAATPAEHKQIHVLPGVGHNNLLAADEFGRALSQFMQAHGL